MTGAFNFIFMGFFDGHWRMKRSDANGCKIVMTLFMVFYLDKISIKRYQMYWPMLNIHRIMAKKLLV